jgi:Type VI secretion system (T6SS), amidase effector protein 4
MQQSKHLPAFALMVVILFVFSCQKTDSLTMPPLTDNALVQRLLSLPITTQPHIVRIAGAMQQADSRHHFIASLARQHGFAQWGKALTTNTANNRSGRNNTTPNGDTIVYIPLVLQNAQHVNAFICAKLNGSISVQLHRETDFLSQGFGPLEDTVPNADKLAVQFMVLDFEVFGHERFKLLHDSLMQGPALPNDAIVEGKIVKMNRATSAAQRGFQTWEYDLCTDTRYLECTTNHSCCPDGGCGACQELCWKTRTLCQKVSVLVFVDNGNWGNGNGSGGGGTGGNGWTVSPSGVIPCNTTPLLDNGLIPCPDGNTTGWTVIFPKAHTEFDVTITDNDPDAVWWNDNTTDFPAQALPSWNAMYNNYPKKPDGTEMCGSDVYSLIGGSVFANRPPGPFPNACALRVSRALNYSGVTIPAIPGQTFQGADGKNYFLSSAKLYNFMKKTFKIPPNPTESIEVFSKAQGGVDGQNFPGLLSGKKGIYLLQASYPGLFGALGHASLYQGSSCMVNTCDGFHDGCYFDAEGGVEKITLFILN